MHFLQENFSLPQPRPFVLQNQCAWRVTVALNVIFTTHDPFTNLPWPCPGISEIKSSRTKFGRQPQSYITFWSQWSPPCRTLYIHTSTHKMGEVTGVLEETPVAAQSQPWLSCFTYALAFHSADSLSITLNQAVEFWLSSVSSALDLECLEVEIPPSRKTTL